MYKILFVDDSRAVHLFLKQCFDGTDHQIDHANSGEEAVEMLLGDSAKSFDVVFLDWEMPGLTGPDVLKAVREKGLDTPVIMLTSRNSMEDITSMLSLGANEYVMKPFTAELLMEKLESVLEG